MSGSAVVLYVTIEPADPGPRPVPSLAIAGDDHAEVRYSILSSKAIWWTAGLIGLIGLAMAVWLLVAFGEGGDQARNQLDAIKTARTIVIGTGGAAALLLAARRQRTADIALKQKDRDLADVARAHALQERVAAETRAHQEKAYTSRRSSPATRQSRNWLWSLPADALAVRGLPGTGSVDFGQFRWQFTAPATGPIEVEVFNKDLWACPAPTSCTTRSPSIPRWYRSSSARQGPVGHVEAHCEVAARSTAAPARVRLVEPVPAS